MSTAKRTEFLEKYDILCRKYGCYVDVGYGKPMYIMDFLYKENDFQYEKTLNKLWEDVNGG